MIGVLALSGNGLLDDTSSVIHVLRGVVIIPTGVVGKEGSWVLGGRKC